MVVREDGLWGWVGFCWRVVGGCRDGYFVEFVCGVVGWRLVFLFVGVVGVRGFVVFGIIRYSFFCCSYCWLWVVVVLSI